MADTGPRFGGLVVASLAGVVGTKYLLGGALATVDATDVTSVLVMQNIALTFTIGTLLAVVTGAIASGFILSRVMTAVLFLCLIGLSIPAFRAGDLVIISESIGMGLSILYLLVRSPIKRVESAQVDEDDSATRHGSTLR